MTWTLCRWSHHIHGPASLRNPLNSGHFVARLHGFQLRKDTLAVTGAHAVKDDVIQRIYETRSYEGVNEKAEPRRFSEGRSARCHRDLRRHP